VPKPFVDLSDEQVHGLERVLELFAEYLNLDKLLNASIRLSYRTRRVMLFFISHSSGFRAVDEVVACTNSAGRRLRRAMLGARTFKMRRESDDSAEAAAVPGTCWHDPLARLCGCSQYLGKILRAFSRTNIGMREFLIGNRMPIRSRFFSGDPPESTNARARR